jgi:hypothetical protein
MLGETIPVTQVSKFDKGLKPCAVKVARTVSRGGGVREEALLLGTSPMRKYSSEEYWSIA